MILKNKKFIIACSNGIKIPIDEDELIKVYEGIVSNSVKILRQGWFNPSFFVGIIEDVEFMNDFLNNKSHEIDEGKIQEFPKHKDLFPQLREQIQRMGDNKTIKQLP